MALDFVSKEEFENILTSTELYENARVSPESFFVAVKTSCCGQLVSVGLEKSVIASFQMTGKLPSGSIRLTHCADKKNSTSAKEKVEPEVKTKSKSKTKIKVEYYCTFCKAIPTDRSLPNCPICGRLESIVSTANPNELDKKHDIVVTAEHILGYLLYGSGFRLITEPLRVKNSIANYGTPKVTLFPGLYKPARNGISEKDRTYTKVVSGKNPEFKPLEIT